MPGLHGLHILLAGGDRRELEVYRGWVAAGVNVKLYGLNRYPETPPGADAAAIDLKKIEILIFPICGVRKDGTIPLSGGNLAVQPLLEKLPARLQLILAGAVLPPWKEILQERGRLIETAADDELAFLNAIPTAEGAIAQAMSRSAITVHGSQALVLGLGRCGAVLAQALQGLGATVSVLVRRRERAALALTRGWQVVFAADLPCALERADFIFNTVPAPLLTETLLRRVRPETLVLDIASLPGGVDYTAAKRLQLEVHHLPGLPGRVAPRTAGKTLAGVYAKLICLYRQQVEHGRER